MKLYYSPGACSLSPHIVASEAGIPMDLVKVNLREHKTENGADYYAVNPKGYVPALELDNGEFLTEGVAIVQYLADLKPEAKLAPPAGSMDRYRLQEWLTFISSEIHKGFSVLWNPATPEEVRNNAIERLQKRFSFLNEQLQNRQFLMGEAFTVADAYCFTVMNWTNLHKIDISAHTHLTSYLDRIRSRSTVQETMKLEGLLS